MPANPKLYLPNKVYFVTTRTEEGLPFVTAEHLKLILEGIMARATSHNITLCHYLWMGNHLHLILVVRDPEAVKDFMRYIKTESSHAVNRMLGRRQKTVWAEGSDAPILLTADDALDRIAYLYANPAKAHLVDSIDEYPMLSSWQMFRARQYSKRCPVVNRDQIPTIGAKHLSLRQQEAFARALEQASRFKATLRLSPYAWADCFDELKGISKSKLDELLVERIQFKEQVARKARTKPVLGALALRTQNMDVPHQPNKFGRKMICISSDKELRLAFISWAKELFQQARAVYAAWKRGDYSLSFPPGMFPPSRGRQANMLPPL